MSRSRQTSRYGDFNLLWAGQSISSVGSQVTLVAAPLAAVLTLHATALEMGLLRVAGIVPALFLGLGAGAWADRVRRRPLLITANLVSGLALATVPVAALLGTLTLPQLYGVFVATGVAGALWSAAYPAYVPTLIDRDDIVSGNARLRGSSAVAETIGPALGGALVALLTAAVAIAADAGSFLASALFLIGIRRREPPSGHTPAGGEESFTAAIRAGLRYVAQDPLPRAVAGTSALFNLFDGMIFAVYVLYAARDLHLGAIALGVIFALGGIGGVAGAVVARHLQRRFAIGSTLVGAIALAAAGDLVIPLAGGTALVAASILAVAEFGVGLGATVWLVDSVSLLQLRTPTAYQGRVNGTMAVVGSGLEALGALGGGMLGQIGGFRLPLVVGAAGTVTAVVWLLLSPVRKMRFA